MSTDSANELIKVAIVGMTGSGKTVLISTLATKMAQMALEDIFLAPFGDNRRQTLRYTQSNWKILNEGQWPQSTPSGELIELQWELTTKNHQAQVQFFDCAGQDVRSLFRTDDFNPNNLRSDLKRVYDNISSANVLILLVNMKDLLAAPDYVEELMDLDQMFHTLNQRNDIPRKIAVVFSQFDKYKPEVDQQFNGDFLEYIRHYIPLLHGQYIRKRNFEIIPVAAVNDTQFVLNNDEVKQYPVPGFSSYNLEKLIHWIADSVEELAPVIHDYNLKLLKNNKASESLVKTPPTVKTQPSVRTATAARPYTSNSDFPFSIITSIINLVSTFISYTFYFIKLSIFFILAIICLIISGILGLAVGGFLGAAILEEVGAIIFGILGFLISIAIAVRIATKIYNVLFK